VKVPSLTIIILLVLNIITSLVGFNIGLNSPFPDETSYLAMAEGISHGKFSTWFLLDHYYPETLRMPGYPIFLYSVLSLFDSTLAVKLIQLALYYSSLALSFNLILKLGGGREHVELRKMIFLSLTALNIQLPFYAGCISTESLSIFLMVACLYIFIQLENSIIKFAYLGLTFGLLYYFRPAFILLPFFVSVIALYIYKGVILKKHVLVMLFFFIISILPFAGWNKMNHDVFKMTPIEGGAGVAHMGYWSFKLPGNYKDTYYWNIVVFPDITNPFKYSADEYEKNQLTYESEWSKIQKKLDQLLQDEDRLFIEIMKKEGKVQPGRFLLYNSKYTLARESYLWGALISNIKSDPYFYLKTRVYTFVRLFFIGINPDSLNKATSLPSKLKVIYPFLVTFMTIFMGFTMCTLYLVKCAIKVENNVIFIYLIILFQAIIHIPFAIQSRFMVPVHFFIFIIVSIVMAKLNIFSHKKLGIC